MNGSSNASSLNPRRLAVRGGLVVVYAALMALAFTFGKGHTVLLDNKDSEDGSIKAIESMTISVNGGEPIEFMAGDRDMTKVRAQWHTIKIDINGQVVEKKFSVPLGEEMVLLSIPKLLAGQEPAVVPFVLENAPPPPEEPAVEDPSAPTPEAPVTPEAATAPAPAAP